MNLRKEIPIFLASDDNYMPFVAVTLHSIIENASRDYDYTVKILHSGVSQDNVDKIMKYEDENFHIEFVDVKNLLSDVMERLHTRIYYTQTTYYRLFIASMYPQYDKILYIDCDVIVRGDISKLYNIDIGDNLVGATTDQFVLNAPYLYPYVTKALGFSHVTDYFNAGVLIMNLDQFRKQNFEEKFCDLLSKYKFIVQDQDYLNILCKGQVKYISGMWDKMPCKEDSKLEDIHLIHYNLIWKPWHAEIPYSDEFWKYVDKTEYKDHIRDIRANFSEEAYQKKVSDFQGFMDVIVSEVNKPDNYFNLFVKQKA